MAQSFQVSPPDSFVFTKPNEWPKWIRRFERYRLASGLDGKPDAMQVNALVYAMGDEADDRRVDTPTLPRHGKPTRQVHSKPVDSDSAAEGSPTEEESVDVGTEPTTCI